MVEELFFEQDDSAACGVRARTVEEGRSDARDTVVEHWAAADALRN